MKKADQPAFPYPEPVLDGNPAVTFDDMQGLTKRELCAFMAMQGMVGTNPVAEMVLGVGAEEACNMVRDRAYMLADAMLGEEK